MPGLGFRWNPFACEWASFIFDYPIIDRLFRGALSGARLIDCGAGAQYEEGMLALARCFFVDCYVAVDSGYNQSFSTIDGIKVEIVGADMLDALRATERESVSVTLNGIDRMVIRDREYHLKLAHEIERVVPQGGMAFGIFSESLEYLSAQRWADYTPAAWRSRSSGIEGRILQRR